MRTLPLPSDTQADVFALCLSAVTDADLHMRLSAISTILAVSARSYQAHATSATLDAIPRLESLGGVTKKELTALYSDHLSATNGAARAVYDRIRNSAPNKRCPLCGVGTVAHCDHHLPKSRYPDLSILPTNLVPACHFCNDTKKARYPTKPGHQTFHPYFDGHLLSAPWIRATLDPSPTPVLVFDTDPPAWWQQMDRDRVARHFVTCGLGVTFTANANDELPVIRDRLRLLNSRGGTAAVQQFLNDERDVHNSRPNSWQFATYKTLATNAWFVDGGYEMVP